MTTNLNRQIAEAMNFFLFSRVYNVLIVEDKSVTEEGIRQEAEDLLNRCVQEFTHKGNPLGSFFLEKNGFVARIDHRAENEPELSLSFFRTLPPWLVQRLSAQSKVVY